MNLILGIFSRGERPVDVRQFQAVASSVSGWILGDGCCWHTRGLSIGTLFREDIGNEVNLSTSSSMCVASGVVCIADVRLDNREDLCRRLGIRGRSILDYSDQALVLRSYEKWDDRFAERLLGDFSIVIWDSRRERLLLARDHVGVKPLYYYCSNEVVVFASQPSLLTKFEEVPEEVDRKWLVDSLVGIHLPDTLQHTYIRDVKLLKSATVLMVDRQCERSRVYWELDTESVLEYRSDDQYIDRFNELFNQSVRSRAKEQGAVGIELSAGLDSTAIAMALKGAVHGSMIQPFSHICVPGYPNASDQFKDEIGLTDQFSEQVGLSAPTRVDGSESSVGELFSRAANLRSGPALELWSVFSQALYKKIADRGGRILLSGAGGDELVSYRGSSVLVDYCRSGRFHDLVREIASERRRKKSGALRSLRQFLSIVDRAYFRTKGRHCVSTLPDMYLGYLNQNVFEAFGIEERGLAHMDAFLEGSTSEIQARYISNFYPGNRRLPESAFTAASYGIELRYPMLDVPLMEFCIALPLRLKRRHGYGRYLLRRSMQDLPNEIRWREEKGAPAIPWVNMRIVEQKIALEKSLENVQSNALASSLLDFGRLKKDLRTFNLSDWNVPVHMRRPLNLTMSAGIFFSSKKEG